MCGRSERSKSSAGVGLFSWLFSNSQLSTPTVAKTRQRPTCMTPKDGYEFEDTRLSQSPRELEGRKMFLPKANVQLFTIIL